MLRGFLIGLVVWLIQHILQIIAINNMGLSYSPIRENYMAEINQLATTSFIALNVGFVILCLGFIACYYLVSKLKWQND
jgi:hypothetical protein